MDTPVERALSDFLSHAQKAFGPTLISAVLFGSAAEDKVRPTSDVNLMLVLGRFDREEIDGVREAFRTGHASVKLDVMFLLESELADAAESFAVKFSDILERRRVLHGRDPFEGFEIPREARIRRLTQVLLNLVLRLREKYALLSLRDEQLASVVAEAAGPLRACAATLLALEGKPAPTPKEALERLALELGAGGLPAKLSRAREERALPPGEGAAAVLDLIALAGGIRGRAAKLG